MQTVKLVKTDGFLKLGQLLQTRGKVCEKTGFLIEWNWGLCCNFVESGIIN